MKSHSIKILLLVVVFLVPSIKMIAQDKIIAPTPESSREPMSIIDEDGILIEIPNNFSNYCHCQYASDYATFTNIYNALAAREQRALLRHQERLIKDRIEQVMNKRFNSYGDARNFVFKRFSLPTTERLYRDISRDYRNQLNRNSQAVRLAKKYESRLYDIRLREFNNNINPGLLGDLAINNQIIANLSRTAVTNNFNSTNSFITNSENKYKDAYRIVRGITEVKSDEILENAFVSSMVSHFNQYDFVNRVLLMTKYMIYLNTNSPVQAAATYGPETFNPAPYIQNYENTAISNARIRVDAPSLNYLPITDAIAKLQHALNTDVKDAKSWINLNGDNWNTLNTYLQSNNFGNGSLETAGRLFSNYYNDQHTEFLGHFNWKSEDQPRLPTSRDTERVFSIKPNTQGYLSGLKGVGNLFHQLYHAENTRNFRLSGSLIRDIFRENGISVPSGIDVTDIGRMFRFEPGINDYGNQSTTAYRTEIRFRTEGIASHIYNGYVSLDEIFNSLESFNSIKNIIDTFKRGTIDSETAYVLLYMLNRNEFSTNSFNFITQAINILSTQSSINSLDSVYNYLINRNEIFYADAGDTRKVNPKRETKCFDITKPAKVTVYVEQPIPESRELTSDIGHTFVGIEQGGIKRYLGFYPNSRFATLLKPQYSEIHDNSGSPYDVSISTEVSPDQLKRIINDINNFPKTYDLQKYNCSDFGIQIGRKAGLNLPRTIGTYSNILVNFRGRNPADLGEDIRAMSSNGSITIDRNAGNAPTKSGGC